MTDILSADQLERAFHQFEAARTVAPTSQLVWGGHAVIASHKKLLALAKRLTAALAKADDNLHVEFGGTHNARCENHNLLQECERAGLDESAPKS